MTGISDTDQHLSLDIHGLSITDIHVTLDHSVRVPPTPPHPTPRPTPTTHLLPSQLGTADAESKVPSVEKTPEMCKILPFEAWGRSEYSLACFAHCQEFLPCPNFYLPGPFTFKHPPPPPLPTHPPPQSSPYFQTELLLAQCLARVSKAAFTVITREPLIAVSGYLSGATVFWFKQSLFAFIKIWTIKTIV